MSVELVDYYIDILEFLDQLRDVEEFYMRVCNLRDLILENDPTYTENYFVACFIQGLKPTIADYVRNCAPNTLSSAYELASQKETELNTLPVWSREEHSTMDRAVNTIVEDVNEAEKLVMPWQQCKEVLHYIKVQTSAALQIAKEVVPDVALPKSKEKTQNHANHNVIESEYVPASHAPSTCSSSATNLANNDIDIHCYTSAGAWKIITGKDLGNVKSLLFQSEGPYCSCYEYRGEVTTMLCIAQTSWQLVYQGSLEHDQDSWHDIVRVVSLARVYVMVQFKTRVQNQNNLGDKLYVVVLRKAADNIIMHCCNSNSVKFFFTLAKILLDSRLYLSFHQTDISSLCEGGTFDALVELIMGFDLVSSGSLGDVFKKLQSVSAHMLPVAALCSGFYCWEMCLQSFRLCTGFWLDRVLMLILWTCNCPLFLVCSILGFSYMLYSRRRPRVLVLISSYSSCIHRALTGLTGLCFLVRLCQWCLSHYSENLLQLIWLIAWQFHDGIFSDNVLPASSLSLVPGITSYCVMLLSTHSAWSYIFVVQLMMRDSRAIALQWTYSQRLIISLLMYFSFSLHLRVFISGAAFSVQGSYALLLRLEDCNAQVAIPRYNSISGKELLLWLIVWDDSVFAIISDQVYASSSPQGYFYCLDALLSNVFVSRHLQYTMTYIQAAQKGTTKCSATTHVDPGILMFHYRDVFHDSVSSGDEIPGLLMLQYQLSYATSQLSSSLPRFSYASVLSMGTMFALIFGVYHIQWRSRRLHQHIHMCHTLVNLIISMTIAAILWKISEQNGVVLVHVSSFVQMLWGVHKCRLYLRGSKSCLFEQHCSTSVCHLEYLILYNSLSFMLLSIWCFDPGIRMSIVSLV